MAKSDTFQCSVVTPERTMVECAATFVAFPAHDGEMGVLFNRSPLLCKLGVGRLRIEAPTENHTMYIDGGFAQVVDNRLTILDRAGRPPGGHRPRRGRRGLNRSSGHEDHRREFLQSPHPRNPAQPDPNSAGY